MDTNFFKYIAQLDIVGTLNLSITKGTEDKIIVSLLVDNKACGDKAKSLIPPLILKGTAEELDNDFFTTIVKPIEDTSGLMVDMEKYIKSQEIAKRQSQMEKEKAEKEKKEKEKREKKYKELKEKAEELAEQGKPRDAWTAYPNPDEYPEHADEIRTRRKELSALFQPNLFS